MPGCYLEGHQCDNGAVYRIPLNSFPVLVGRESDLTVMLDSDNVSRQHAEIYLRQSLLMIRDLGSTNGTFVNHERINGDQALRTGDVIRFADVEFRLLNKNDVRESLVSDSTETAFFVPDKQVNRLPTGARHLERLLREKLIDPFFQPILSIEDEKIVGLELLGRGGHSELSELPVPLFNLADSLGCSIELSEIMREIGVLAWASSGLRSVPLFLNTQPQELNQPQRLVDSLKKIRDDQPQLSLVLEIHEQAVTDLDTLQTLYRELQALDIDLAYDDFGAGQARLQEILSTPPYVVKFDISLVRDLDKAHEHQREMIGLLVKLVKKGQTCALAEGVSRPEELAVCRSLGFDMIQGFIYGKPVPLEQLGISPYW